MDDEPTAGAPSAVGPEHWPGARVDALRDALAASRKIWDSIGWPRRPLPPGEYLWIMARLEDYITSRFPEKFDSATTAEIATTALKEFMAPLYARPLLPDSPNPEDLLTIVTNCALDRLGGTLSSQASSSADEALDDDNRLLGVLFGEHIGHEQVRAMLANVRKEHQVAEFLVVTEYITLFERYRYRPKLDEVAKELRPLEQYLRRTIDEAFVQRMLFKFVNRLPAEGG